MSSSALQVPSIITVLETVLNKGDLHSMVVEYEALNVVIRYVLFYYNDEQIGQN